MLHQRSSFGELCHQVVDRASLNLSPSELSPGLVDASCKGLASTISLPATDDLDKILLSLSADRSYVGGDLFFAEAGGALPNPSPDFVETTQYLVLRVFQEALEFVVRQEDSLRLLIASNDVRDVIFGDLVEDGAEALP